MIDSQKIKAIELLISGEHNITQVAELVGVHRTTIYNWMNNEEFMAEFNKRLQEIKTLAQKEFDAKLDIAINEYWKLATDPKTEARTKQIALSYWIDRALGKTTSKLELSDRDKDNANISDNDILDAINEDKDNIIDIDEVKRAK